MAVSKIPTQAGAYWAALDDSELVVEVVLLHVRYYSGETSFAEGADVRFVDGSGRQFTMSSMTQRIVQPGVPIVLGHATMSMCPEVRITWLGEARPPRGAPQSGSPCNAQFVQ